MAQEYRALFMERALWVGDFAAEVSMLKLAEWHLFHQRETPGPAWEVVMHGYFEADHHDQATPVN